MTNEELLIQIDELTTKIKEYVDAGDISTIANINELKAKIDELISLGTAEKIAELSAIVDELELEDETLLQLVQSVKVGQDSILVKVSDIELGLNSNTESDNALAERVNTVEQQIGSLASVDALDGLANTIATGVTNSIDKFTISTDTTSTTDTAV
ncbi:MAG: hypothetical protein E6R13_02595 [Spirochaetes bacterium]|nr:MAG: hypothetical protein E6R13_02595 [Spirochaetota bacterium]